MEWDDAPQRILLYQDLVDVEVTFPTTSYDGGLPCNPLQHSMTCFQIVGFGYQPLGKACGMHSFYFKIQDPPTCLDLPSATSPIDTPPRD
jgi:hypothetical protein